MEFVPWITKQCISKSEANVQQNGPNAEFVKLR